MLNALLYPIKGCTNFVQMCVTGIARDTKFCINVPIYIL